MTNQEFSDLFDLLFNNTASTQSPGLDDWEKSVFLTKALDEIIKAYFNPAYNKAGEGFDSNLRRLIDFSMLVTVDNPTLSNGAFAFGNRAGTWHATMPSNVMMIINELLEVSRSGRNVTLLVIPLSFTEYTRMMSKPYKRPLHYQAWRISNSNGGVISNQGGISNIADIIAGPSDTISSASNTYTVRYVRRPCPIILFDLEDVTIGADGILWTWQSNGSTSISNTKKYFKLIGDAYVYVPNPIDSEKSQYYVKVYQQGGEGTQAQECELDPILHEEILQRAVELAKASYSNLDTVIGVGNSSATEKGVVARQQQ